MKLNDFIKQRREYLEMSRYKLSQQTGISHTEIYRIEKGERKEPSLTNLMKLSKALQIPMKELLKKVGCLLDIEETTKTINMRETNKILVCPYCEYELSDDHNFNVTVISFDDIELGYSESNAISWYALGKPKFLKYDTIYCCKCRNEFHTFKIKEEE